MLNQAVRDACTGALVGEAVVGVRLSRRWLVPALVGAGIVGIGTVPHAFASGDSAPNLPPVSPAQLITDVETSSVRAFFGTVTVDSALGLPSLPDRLVGSAA
jgi:hypothetical protein